MQQLKQNESRQRVNCSDAPLTRSNCRDVTLNHTARQVSVFSDFVYILRLQLFSSQLIDGFTLNMYLPLMIGLIGFAAATAFDATPDLLLSELPRELLKRIFGDLNGLT